MPTFVRIRNRATGRGTIGLEAGLKEVSWVRATTSRNPLLLLVMNSFVRQQQEAREKFCQASHAPSLVTWREQHAVRGLAGQQKQVLSSYGVSHVP